MTPPITARFEERGSAFKPGTWMPAETANSDLELQRAYSLIEAQRRRIAELEDLATRDDLTGLSNRRGLMDVIAKENDRIKRGQSTGATLVMIDLNDFKSINDENGHDAGDAALRAVGNTLLSFIRTTDMAARIGGDEFLLLLTHTSPSQVARRVSQLDDYLNGLAFKWNKSTIAVHASIGSIPLDGETAPEKLLRKADKAMYDVKTLRKKNKRSAADMTSTSRSERITA